MRKVQSILARLQRNREERLRSRVVRAGAPGLLAGGTGTVDKEDDTTSSALHTPWAFDRTGKVSRGDRVGRITRSGAVDQGLSSKSINKSINK